MIDIGIDDWLEQTMDRFVKREAEREIEIGAKTGARSVDYRATPKLHGESTQREQIDIPKGSVKREIEELPSLRRQIYRVISDHYRLRSDISGRPLIVYPLEIISEIAAILANVTCKMEGAELQSALLEYFASALDRFRHLETTGIRELL